MSGTRGRMIDGSRRMRGRDVGWRVDPSRLWHPPGSIDKFASGQKACLVCIPRSVHRPCNIVSRGSRVRVTCVVRHLYTFHPAKYPSRDERSTEFEFPTNFPLLIYRFRFLFIYFLLNRSINPSSLFFSIFHPRK